MRKAIKWLMLTAVFIGVILIGNYFYSLYNSLEGLHKGNKGIAGYNGNASGVAAEEPPKWEGNERVNILLMGGDSRGKTKGDPPRSDTIMIASIDPQTKKATLFSILRDTYVKIPGNGKDRINAAYTYGGPNLAVKTVSDFTGLQIQYYAYTDFQGFMALVDEIGGIDLDVEKNMDYEDAWDGHLYDIHLKKGFQHLDGKTALQYVRFRHDATSDYSRTERQRKFMMAVARKMQSTTNILKLPQIINAIDPYIDTNLSVGTMIKLGTLGYQVKGNGINGQQLPPSNLIEEVRIGGAQMLTANPANIRKFVQDTLDNQTNGIDPSASPSSSSLSRTNSSSNGKQQAEDTAGPGSGKK
jgi:LCP family protein required for cell wall assembly